MQSLKDLALTNDAVKEVGGTSTKGHHWEEWRLAGVVVFHSS